MELLDKKMCIHLHKGHTEWGGGWGSLRPAWYSALSSTAKWKNRSRKKNRRKFLQVEWPTPIIPEFMRREDEEELEAKLTYTVSVNLTRAT